MTDHTLCKVCSAPRVPHLGLYCRACYNRAVYIRKHGTDEGYKPYAEKSDTCANCSREIKQRHANFRTLCHSCGVAKHRKYQQDRRAARRQSPKPRAKGQEMAPPAPRVEVKPEKVVVPDHIVVTRVPCPFGRFEGRSTIWDERAEG
jgi:hypothetical protein